MSNSNGWDNFTKDARNAIIAAEELARENGADSIEREHFLAAVLQVESEDENLSTLLALCGLKREEIAIYAHAAFQTGRDLATERRAFSEAASQALTYAAIEAHRDLATKIGLEHLFIGLITPQKGSHLDATLAPLKLKDIEVSRRLTTINDDKRNAQIFTEGMEKVLDSAQAAMRATYCGRIAPLHLLLGILENPDSNACRALLEANIDLEELTAKSKKEIVTDHENSTGQKRYSKAAQRVLYRPQLLTTESNFLYTSPEHLLFALLPQSVSLKENLKEKRNFGDVEALDDFWKSYDVELIREKLTTNFVTGAKEQRIDGLKRSPSVYRSREDHRGMLLEFGVPVFLGWGLIFGISHAGSNTMWASPQSMAIFGLLVLLVGGGIFAIIVQLFSKNKQLKERSIRIFLSFIVGLFLGAATASR